MKKEEDIIALIKSLSQSEKRYFKLAASKNRENSKYLTLFDLFDKTGNAQEKVIKKLYKNEPITAEQFKVYKHRLFGQILKSLGDFHSGKSIDSKLRELLEQAESLYNKALYAVAMKSLAKAKKLAYTYEKFTIIPEIISWEKKILVQLSYESFNKKNIENINEEEIRIQEIIKNKHDYWNVYSQLLTIYRFEGLPRTSTEAKVYKSILNNPLLKNVEDALSYDAKKYFFISHTLYYHAIDTPVEGYDNAKKFIAFLEKRLSVYLKSDSMAYLNALNDLLLYCLSLKKYQEFFDTILKIKVFIAKSGAKITERDRLWSLELSLNMQLAGYIETGQFSKGIFLVPEIENILRQEKISYTNQLLFKANIAILYIGCEGYQKALFYINSILNDKKGNLYQDIYNAVLMMQLIIHYELGNIDLLSFMIKSVYHSLLKKDKLYKIEAELIQFIKLKINKIKNAKDQLEAFKELRNKFVEIAKDPFEAAFLKNSFDYISWLESKIENKSLAKILQEKSGYLAQEKN